MSVKQDFWQKLKILFGNILLAKYVGMFLCLKQPYNCEESNVSIYWNNLDQSLNYCGLLIVRKPAWMLSQEPYLEKY